MRRGIVVRVGLLALVVLAAGSARADFVNPGFETPIVGGGQFLLITPATIPAGFGWTPVGVDLLLLQNTYSEPANGITFNSHSGLNALDVTGNSNTGPTDGVYQDIATIAGQVYNLSFWVGRAGGTAAIYANPATVDLQINNGARTSFTNSDLTVGSVNWKLFTTSFTAGAGSTTRISFLNGTPVGTSYAGLDDVSVTPAAIPEPTSIALLGCGLSVALIAGRRARRRD